MAAVVALMAKDNKGPEIKLQILSGRLRMPALKPVPIPVWHQQLCEQDTMLWFWDNYTTDADERNPGLSLLLCSAAVADQLTGLPPALVQTC